MRIFFLFTVLMLQMEAGAQEVPFEQTDANGKKHGDWIVWLNEHLKEIKDSSKATYKRYDRYLHGRDIYNLGGLPAGMQLQGPAASDKGTPGWLDGEYRAVDKKGTTRYLVVADKGRIVVLKEFNKDGSLKWHWDYTPHKDDLYSYYVTGYGKAGEVTKYVVRDGNAGFRMYYVAE